MEKNLFRFTVFLSVMLTAIFIGGSVYAMVFIFNPIEKLSSNITSASNVELKTMFTESSLHIVALGDSLTRGAGDETNQGGYVSQVKRLLESGLDKEITLYNNGVNGLRAPQLLEQVQSMPVIREQVSQANLILITIGGNDLGGFQAINNDEEKIQEIMPPALLAIKQILQEIRQLNPTAIIIYSGLYNPFADSSKSRLFNSYLTTWNGSVNEMLESDSQAVVVPTADIFKLRLYEYLSPDQFHPNKAGYDAIADRVTSLLK